MRPIYKSIFLFLLLVSDSTMTRCQSITLDDCLRLARENSPALRAAEDVIRAADLAKEELSTEALPRLRGVVGATYAPLPPSLGYDPALSNGGQIAAQLILEESLYDGGMRGVRSNQMQLDSKRLFGEWKRTERDLIFLVKQAFIEVLRSQQEEELQRDGVNQLASYLNLVQSLYNGGNVSYTDILKTEVQLSGARISLRRAIEASRTATYSLAELIGVPIDSPSVITGTLRNLSSERPDSVTTNVDLQIARLEMERSMLEADLAERERLPKISFFGDAGYLTSIENLRLPSEQQVTGLGYSIGIGIELPIFNWGATGLRVSQRNLEANALRQQLELLRRSLRSELQKVRLQLAGARNRLLESSTNVEKAEENFLLTRSQFAGGATLSLEVLAAQQLVTDARIAELQALADIQLLMARLEQLTSE